MVLTMTEVTEKALNIMIPQLEEFANIDFQQIPKVIEGTSDVIWIYAIENAEKMTKYPSDFKGSKIEETAYEIASDFYQNKLYVFDHTSNSVIINIASEKENPNLKFENLIYNLSIALQVEAIKSSKESKEKITHLADIITDYKKTPNDVAFTKKMGSKGLALLTTHNILNLNKNLSIDFSDSYFRIETFVNSFNPYCPEIKKELKNFNTLNNIANRKSLITMDDLTGDNLNYKKIINEINELYTSSVEKSAHYLFDLIKFNNMLTDLEKTVVFNGMGISYAKDLMNSGRSFTDISKHDPKSLTDLDVPLYMK